MHLRVFLSSTRNDLEDARSRILRFLSVIPGELLTMEHFGSDESAPVDFCLQQVSQCNLFIGIYAERYGTIDAATGVSITELEYRRALEMLRAGRLYGLLIYILDPRAAWPMDQVDRDAAKAQRLAGLKERLKQNHLVTFFGDTDALSLQVLKDVLRKAGVGLGTAFAARVPVASDTRRGMPPVGMEHYTERDSAYFHGRERAVADLSDLLASHSIALLIGDSGIGKTSLVQAGLASALKSRGWAVALCRPLDDPDAVICDVLWGQLMQGQLPEGISLLGALELIGSAHEGREVLVVIDQFEDAIPSLRQPNTSQLLAALARVHASPIPNVRLLICYRGDADPKVGRCWQIVSGSPAGLPRYYLEPIDRDAAEVVLREVLGAADDGQVAQPDDAMVRLVAQDLEAESATNYMGGIYPPFLQMVAESLLRGQRETRAPASVDAYGAAGRARSLVGRYLIDQLKYMPEHRREAIRLLHALAGRTRRHRKSIEELAAETDLPQDLVASSLDQLASLRLVRADAERWEIVHDFVAERVLQDLVDPDELEARTFRDLAIAKAAAFDKTGELLTTKEHLGLYAHRHRIPLTEPETARLFISYLAGHGPAAYYLARVPDDTVLAWAERQLSAEDYDTRLNAHRFLLQRARAFPLAELARVFGERMLQAELSSLILRFAGDTDDEVRLLLRLRTRRAEMVAAAARVALEERVKSVSDRPFLMGTLLRSRQTPDLRLLCRLLGREADSAYVDRYRSALSSKLLPERIRAVCGLAAVGSTADIQTIMVRMQRGRTRERRVCAHALAAYYQARGDQRGLTSLLCSRDEDVVLGALTAVDGGRAGVPIARLLRCRRRFPAEVADAVRRSAQVEDRGELEAFVRASRLDVPSRDFVIAMASVGDGSDVRTVIELIGAAEYRVEFWAAQLLVDVLAARSTPDLLSWLQAMIENDDFWRYRGPKETLGSLPVRHHGNQYIFKRMVASCFAAVAGGRERPLLRRLLFHDFWYIQTEAGRALTRLGDQQDLDGAIAELRARPFPVGGGQPYSGAIRAICQLDDRLYGAPAAAVCPVGLP